MPDVGPYELVTEDTVFTVETSTKDNLTQVFVRHGDLYVTGRDRVTYRYPLLEFHSGTSTALGRALRELADRMDPGGDPTRKPRF